MYRKQRRLKLLEEGGAVKNYSNRTEQWELEEKGRGRGRGRGKTTCHSTSPPAGESSTPAVGRRPSALVSPAAHSTSPACSVEHTCSNEGRRERRRGGRWKKGMKRRGRVGKE